MRYSASVVLVPAYQESGIPTHPKHSLRAPPPPAFVALTVPRLYSSFNMVLIKNNPDERCQWRSKCNVVGMYTCMISYRAPHIDLVAEGPSISSPHPSSQGPSSTPSPEFSDEESPHEPSNFSFHLYQGEEWTDEVEARRLLAEPTINFSERFPDDFLEDSANPQTSCSAASSLEDDDGSYSGDQEDGAEEEEGLGMDIVWEESAAFFVVEEDPHSPPLSFEHATCFEERQWVKVRITTKSSVEPPIPPTPPDVYLRQRRRRWKPPDPFTM
ncbi:hypothetical protein EV363DRAFT_1339640, partial [Boletus edulis]